MEFEVTGIILKFGASRSVTAIGVGVANDIVLPNLKYISEITG